MLILKNTKKKQTTPIHTIKNMVSKEDRSFLWLVYKTKSEIFDVSDNEEKQEVQGKLNDIEEKIGSNTSLQEFDEKEDHNDGVNKKSELGKKNNEEKSIDSG